MRDRPQGRKRLSLGTGALLMLGVGTAALIGLPGMTEEAAPDGVINGVVCDPSGHPVADAPVALFDGRSNALLEITRSDDKGRFGFQQDPGSHHLHAMAPEHSDLIGTWDLDCPRGQRSAQLNLALGHRFQAIVKDEAGQPIVGAEVRVYAKSGDDGTLCVLTKTRTDAAGQALLQAPAQAHVAAFSSDLRHRPQWRFNQAFPTKDTTLPFTLLTGHPVRGTVVDEGGRPLSGMLVSSWEGGENGLQWNGYQVTGAGGTFLFFGSGDGTLVRSCDRRQGHLPAERMIDGNADVVLVMETGTRQPIRCRDASGQVQAARVWSWSSTAEAWSWGTETNSAGLLEASLDPKGDLVIEPLEANLGIAVQAFGQGIAPGPIEIEFRASSPSHSDETMNAAR